MESLFDIKLERIFAQMILRTSLFVVSFYFLAFVLLFFFLLMEHFFIFIHLYRFFFRKTLVFI